MKKIIVVFISILFYINSFAADEVTVMVDGCTESHYIEVINKLHIEDIYQQIGMSSNNCSRGALMERRVGETTIHTSYGIDYSNECSLRAIRTYYCHRLPW